MSSQSIVQRVGTITVRRDAQPDTREFQVTISTDTPQPGRRAAREVLSHEEGAIDLSRATHGLPVTVAHDAGRLPVGRVGDLAVRDGRMTGTLRIASSQAAIASDIREGIITDVSVGAMIDPEDFQELEDGTIVARRWLPIEASLVTFGNDREAVIQRDRKTEDDSKGDGKTDDRRATIQRLFAGLHGDTFSRMEREALYSDDSVEVIRGRVDAALREALNTQHTDTTRTNSGEDALEKWATAVERAFEFRAGLMEPDQAREYARNLHGNEIASMSLSEMSRDYLRRRGIAVPGSRKVMVERALAVPAVMLERAIFSHTTSDFSNLLAAGSDKALARGFTEAPETYQAWASNVNLSNFRATSFPVLSTFEDLDQIPDTGDFKYGSFSDKAESMTLKAYGKLFSIGRQAIINDDLGAFTRIPGHMGRAAARKVGDLVYAVLTANATMTETSRALFNTTDSTLAGSGGAISTTTLDTAATAMGTQTDPAGNVLNIEPAYLIVPRAKETVARVQVSSEKDPGEGTTTSFDKPNPFRNRLQVVADARLDANSTTAWYLMAAKNGPVETVAVGWLDGVMRPRLEQQTGFEQDGIAYKIAIDCTAGALDYRGSYKNAGA